MCVFSTLKICVERKNKGQCGTNHHLFWQFQTLKKISQSVSLSVSQSVSQLVTSINFHQHSSKSIHFYPLLYIFIHFIPFYRPKLIFINFHTLHTLWPTFSHFHQNSIILFNFIKKNQFHPISCAFNQFIPI